MKKNVKVVAMLSSVLIMFLMPLQGISQDVFSNKVIVGTELDLLPYITGGYYGSLVLGYAGWRVRGIVTQTSPPDFVVADGFEDYELEVKTFLLDRFFGNRASRL